MIIDFTTQKRVKALFETMRQKQTESYKDLEINRDIYLTFEKADQKLNIMVSIKDPQNYYDDFVGFESQIKRKSEYLDTIISQIEQITNNELNFYCEPYGKNDKKHFWISNELEI